MSDQPPVTINRSLVGWLALACWISAGVSLGFDAEGVPLWQAVSTRVGLVLTALWMALPKDGRLGNWANVSMTTLIAIVAAIFVAARNPWRTIPIILAVAAVARMLRPRDKPRPPRVV